MFIVSCVIFDFLFLCKQSILSDAYMLTIKELEKGFR